jgi:hypothetical protein
MFSRASFGENRSIFNTPNPRLMNASFMAGGPRKQDAEAENEDQGEEAPASDRPRDIFCTHRPSRLMAQKGGETADKAGRLTPQKTTTTSLSRRNIEVGGGGNMGGIRSNCGYIDFKIFTVQYWRLF